MIQRSNDRGLSVWVPPPEGHLNQNMLEHRLGGVECMEGALELTKMKRQKPSGEACLGRQMYKFHHCFWFQMKLSVSLWLWPEGLYESMSIFGHSLTHCHC